MTGECISREEYQELRDIVIESRNDIRHLNNRLIEYMDDQNTTCKQCFEDHEKRIRTLERWQWKATGIASAITGFFGAFAGLIAGKGGS